MKKIILTSFIGLSVLVFSCKKETTTPTTSTTNTNSNNNSNSNSSNGVLTLTFDNVTKTLANQKITLTKYNSDNTSVNSDHQIYYDFQIWGEVDGGNLAMDFTNFEWQNPNANTILAKTYYNYAPLNGDICKSVNGNKYCQEFLVVYDNKQDSNGPWSTFSEFDGVDYLNDKSYFKITEMNGTTKKVSGNFEIKVFRTISTDTSDVNETKTIKGSFTNLSYIVQ
jgi:hypothetical protein